MKYLISMEMVLEGSILQIIATLLRLLPIDLIKHFCTYYSNCVNLIQASRLCLILIYPQLKTENNVT